MGEAFYKCKRSAAARELLRDDPKAFLLLSVIAMRAKYHDGPNTLGLQVGECVIGDDAKYGMTRKERRCALDRLNRAGITASRRATTGARKGTIVKLVNSDIFDINMPNEGPLEGPLEGPEEGPLQGHSGATNKESKGEEKNTPPKKEEEPPAPGKHPPCPQKEIIKLYHEILPTLAVMEVWTETDETNLRARWRMNPKYQSLDFWRGLFQWIRDHNKFLLGQNDRNWTADLRWLVKSQNFAKLMSKKYMDKAKRVDQEAKEWADG